METNMELWLMGLYDKCDNCEKKWRLIGVYDSEEKAIKACTIDDNFIAPIILNQKNLLNSKAKIWKDLYYPQLETKKEGNLRNRKHYEHQRI